MNSLPAQASQQHPELISKAPASDNQLNTYLADRDEPCPLCGYNLRNLQTDRCPECGRQLRLTVGLAEPALGAWVATLVALLLPAAFGLLIIVLFFIGLAYEPHMRVVRQFMNLPGSVQFIFLHLLTSVPLSVVMLTNRRRFITLRQEAQRGFALLAWVMIAVSITCVLVEAIR